MGHSEFQHLLCSLISVKCKAPSRTFHDDGGAETTEYAGFVAFRWMQLGDDSIITLVEPGFASRAYSVIARGIRQSQGI